jgi:hypothetical protein
MEYKPGQTVLFRGRPAEIEFIYSPPGDKKTLYAIKYKVKGREVHRVCDNTEIKEQEQTTFFN